MSRLIGLALVATGAVLGWMGWQEQQTMGSRLRDALSGSPSDRAFWLLAIGALVALAGLVLFVRGGRR